MIRVCLTALFALHFCFAQSNEGGQLDASRTLFSVMSALNAAGLDTDAESPSNHPLRAAVRKHLAGKNIPVLKELQTYIAVHRKPDSGANLGQYISFALTSDDPPRFDALLLGNEKPPDVEELDGFRALLVRFHEEADIDTLWRQAQPAFDAAIAAYHERVARSLLEVNGYLRNPTTGGYMGRRFLIYLDLLGPPNQVHTRSYKDDYFIVVTPSSELRIDDIRHSYLHYLLDPLATKYSAKVQRVRGLGDFAKAAAALEESYKDDFQLLATESLIKAIESRIDRKPSNVQQALSEGFVLTPYFAEHLPVYEKQGVAMRLHLPDMFDAIDLKKEDRRLEQVQFASARAVRKAPAAEPSPAAPIPPAELTVQEAEKFYGARELDKARETYRRALGQTEDKTVHARAYYGLARIAALERQPELAEQLFRKTLELTPDPHTHSWTEVYLARLAEAAGERGQAAQHYKAALAVQGLSPGARQAAEQGLQKTMSP